MEDILTAFIAKTLNIAQEQVAELVKTDDNKSIKDNALQLLLDKDVDRITSLKLKSSDDGKTFDNGYKKAQSEVLSNFEDDIKKKYEITTEAKGSDLIQEIINGKIKNVDKKEVTDDDIKRSTTYLNALKSVEQKKLDEINSIKESHRKELNVFVRKEKLSDVFKSADDILNKSLIDFSKDPTISMNQRNVVHKLLAEKDYDVKEDKTILPLNSEGKLLEDDHGHPIPFENIVLESASFLPVRKSEDRDSGGGTGDDTQPNQTGFSWNGQKPKSDDEFVNLISEAKTLEEKKAITESYDN